MNKGKWAVTHASSSLAEALLEKMAAIGIDSEEVILLDVEDQTGKRLSYADTYLETLDQTEFDYEGLIAVLLLQQDDELESLLQHADCFVVSHYFDADTIAVYVPGQSNSLDWSNPQPVKLASAELSSVLSVLAPLQSSFDFKSLQLVNILSVAFFGKSAVDELASQTISLLNSQKPESKVFPIQLAFNMQPVKTSNVMGEQISSMLEGSVDCSVQSILAPAFHGLAISVTLECEKVIDLSKFMSQLKENKSIMVSEDTVSPMTHCQNDENLYVSMLEQSRKNACRVQFWIIADSTRNGLLENYMQCIRRLSHSSGH